MTAQSSPTAPASVPWYGTASNWADIIKGGAQGATSAMAGASAYANSKEEAKEAKRRTLSNLLSQALKRNRNLFRVGQEYSDEMNDFQSQALQNVARGFVDALQGATSRRK